MNKKILLLSILLTYNISIKAQNNVRAGENIGDTGQVSFNYQNENVTYTTVRASDGYEWLQQNLGSKQVATSIDDESAYGDYFQYGRWDDGHQLKDSETTEVYPSPNNPIGLGNGTPYFYIGGGTPWASNYTGWFANPLQNDDWSAKNLSEVTANNGMDPCKAIGNNWEIPTEADWDKVFQEEKIFPRPDNTSVGVDRGFKSNLKIPGAGARKDSSWSFVGQRAYLWTRSASNNPNFYRYVYLGTYAGSSTGFGGDSKSFGYPVRCINKSSSNLNTSDLTDNTNKVQLVVNNNNLQIHTEKTIEEVKIYNLNGQVVLSSNQKIISISILKPGVYITSIKNSNGQISNIKFIKK